MLRSFLLILLLTSSAFAQFGNPLSVTLKKPDAKTVFLLTSDLDSVVIRATNDKGDHLPKLKPEDFLITRNGDTAVILSCRETQNVTSKDLALTFILDNSASMFHSYDSVTKYLDEFIDSIANGFVGNIITFDNNERKPSYESSRNKLFIALSGFSSDRVALKDFWHSYDTIRSDFTPLYDALITGLRRITQRKLSGDSLRQEIVIVVTDGADNSSASNISTLKEYILALPITLYTVSYRVEPDGKLDWIAKKTKGKHYTTDELFILKGILDEIRKNISASYTLKYEFPFKGAVGR